MNVRYREWAPQSRLRPWVKCLWLLEHPAGASAPERVLPDGCDELVLHYGERFRQYGLVPRADRDGAGGHGPRCRPGRRDAARERGLHLRVSGVGFRPDAEVAISSATFGPALDAEIVVTSATVVDPTTLDLTIDVSPTAALGPADVIVMNQGVVVPNRARLLDVVPFSDLDSDGVGDIRDCAPKDAAVWALPAPVGATLVLDRDDQASARLSWQAVPPAIGVPVRYVVARGLQSELAGSDGTEFGGCFARDLVTTSFDDPATPPANEVLLYLVTSENACGTGGFGAQARDADLADCL